MQRSIYAYYSQHTRYTLLTIPRQYQSSLYLVSITQNQTHTAQELAFKLQIDTTDIVTTDNLRLKEVPDYMKSKILPILRGDDIDHIP